MGKTSCDRTEGEIKLTEIKKITDDNLKIQIMKNCDEVFPIRLFERENCDEIIQKIISRAIFYAAFEKLRGKYQDVGYVAFYANDLDNQCAYISHIGVCREMQGKQIGSKLMEICLKEAELCGMRKIRLEVLKTNTKAISFYEKWRFEYESENKGDTCYLYRYL